MTIIQLEKVLEIFGAVTIIGIIGFFIICLIIKIKDIIYDLRESYKIAHRFDKPPTAKCFCIDCAFYRKDSRCTLPGNDRYTPDCGFCYEADPKKEKRIKKNAID